MGIRLSLAFACGLAVFGSASAQPVPRIDSQRLEAFVDGAVAHAMAEDHLAGVAVAVIDRDGPLLIKGYGVAHLPPPDALRAHPQGGGGREVRVDGDTMFRIGSISKTVTWIAIEQLVAAGKLSLDDEVNAHLPKNLQIPDEGFGEPIRIANLMAHNAGFEDAALGTNVTLDPRRALPLDEYLARYRVHRVRPPGVLTVYSNYGTALAGAIVEHVTGMDFQTYAEEKILRPLGAERFTFRDPYAPEMRGRGFAAPMPGETWKHESAGFQYSGGRFVEKTWEFIPHMAPAGAGSASARDMAAYMAAILSPSLFEQAGVLTRDQARAMREKLFANDDRLGANRHGFWEIANPAEEFAFGHNGGMAFQQTFMGIYPRSGIAIFVANNTAGVNAGSNIISDLPRLIVKEFVGDRPLKRAKASEADAARYAGCYRTLRRSYYRTEAAIFRLLPGICVSPQPNGDIQVFGEPWIPLGKGVWANPKTHARIAFGEREGRMMVFDPSSTAPAARMGFFDGTDLLYILGALAQFIALVRLATGVLRMLRGDEDLAHLSLDALSLLWLVSAAVFAMATVPWLSDNSAPLLNYPGMLLPVACWLFVAASVATVVVAGLILTLFRPDTWHWTTWASAAVTLLVYVLLGAELWNFGLLGFVGW